MVDSNPARLRPRLGLVLGPALGLLLLGIGPPADLSAEAWRVAAVGVLMAAWWITEAVPIPATALLPLALFPLLGVLPIQPTAAPYANPVIFLFLGGFLIAQSMERWGLHRRIALAVLGVAGANPRRIVGAFMAATAFLSMWVSNTATAIMMISIARSVAAMPRRDDVGGSFAVALMLAIAYSASIGGIATLVGTPPNALLAGFLSETYGFEIGFARWMAVGLPVTIVMLPIAWLVLTRWLFPVRPDETLAGIAAIRSEQRSLGPMSRGELQTTIVFVATALAWMLRPVLERWIPGVSDAGIAITAGLVLFALPVNLTRGEFMLDWSSAAKLPWSVLVLFGGGLSLAGAIQDSGLADWLGVFLSGAGVLPTLLLLFVVTGLLIFLTELTSNTATAATFFPVLASLAVGLGENPLLLLVPAAVAVSCAFMMPVATPPNAIAYGSGSLTIPQMARAGLVLNLLFLVAIPLIAYALVGVVFGVEAGVLPSWATGD